MANKQLRKKYNEGYVVIEEQEIQMLGYVEGYVFLDRNDFIAPDEADAIFYYLDEHDMAIDLDNVREAAEAVVKGETDIIDIGSIYVEEKDYPGATLVFEGVGEHYRYDDIEFEEAITYWDGSNNTVLWLGDLEAEYKSDDPHICIDEYNGRNYETGGVGYHMYVYKTDENEYIFEEQNDWQGKLDTGYVVQEYELVEQLSMIGRKSWLEDILAL